MKAGFIAAVVVAGFVTTANAQTVSGNVAATHTGHNNFCWQMVSGEKHPSLFGVPLVPNLSTSDMTVDPDMAAAVDRAFENGTQITFEHSDARNVACLVNGQVKVGFRARAIDKGVFK